MPPNEPASTGVREDERGERRESSGGDEARADLIERLEKDAADWEGASEIFKPTPSLLREAASTLQAYEKALREIVNDDPYDGPEVPARAIARAALKGEENG